MSAALNRTFLSLRVPNYRRYFAGQVISLSGNWMQTVAEMWLVVKLTGSGTAVGLVAALQFLPILVFGAMGGVLADRMSKRKLLIVTQALMALPALALIGVLDVGANAFFALGTDTGLLSVVSDLASLYPVATVVLARALLHERLVPLQTAGVAVALAGVGMIAAG